MYHPKLVDFEARLKKLFDEVDAYIENAYGTTYTLHPSRPERGKTANPQADGLFNIGADFTAGYGSEHGRGYLLDVEMATLEKVDKEHRTKIYHDAAEKVGELLPVHFPERELEVVADGRHFKIKGDFSLGNK